MKKPICFFTFASDLYTPLAMKMVNSFKKFHSDIPMFYYGQGEIDKALEDGFQMGRLAPYFGSKLSKDYEIVVSIESDNIVCDKMLEILEGDYEVAMGLNNYEGLLGYELPEVSRTKYLNTGIVASKSERFWELWKKLNLTHADRYRFVEQDVVNNMLEFNDFNVKILDKDRVFYSSSIRKVWEQMEVRNDKIYCADRLVRVIHWAGGNNNKFNWHERKFNPKVCARLDYLTNDAK